MKNQKGFALLALLIPAAIVLIGLVAFGRFYYLPKVNENKNANTNQVVVNTNVNQNENINSAVVNINTNANTNAEVNLNTNTAASSNINYTSQSHHVSFYYPATWQKQTLPPSGLSGVEQYGFTPKTALDNYISTYGNDSFWLTTYQVFVSNKSPKDWFNENISPVSRTDVSEASINGYTAYYAKIAADSYTDREYVISHSGIIVRFHMREISNGQAYSQYVSDFNSIVNSISLTDETAGWKTYTNTPFNYSFRYPATWQVTENKYSSGEPLSANSTIVSDPSGISGSFSVCPENRGSDCIPFQDAEWNSTSSNVTVDGRSSTKISYTVKSTDCPICTPRSVITLGTKPSAWSEGRDFLLVSGSNKLLTIPEEILSTLKFSNKFDISTIKSGDVVAGMTVSTIAPFNADFSAISKENYKIQFSGQATITGSYKIYAPNDGGMGITSDDVCVMEVNKETAINLPREKNDDRTAWFCFTNPAEAKSALGLEPGTRTATMVIDEYKINSYPSEVYNTAKFISKTQ